MNCPKCGAPLEADAKFCMTCGARMEEEPQAAPTGFAPAGPAPAAPAGPAADPVKDLLAKAKGLDLTQIIGLVVGTIFIVLGILQATSAGVSISSTSFGGDFYTYTYRGIVAIANQLAGLQVCLGLVIAAIGAAIDVQSLRK